MKYANGERVPFGRTVTVDHVTQTFVVTINSLAGVGVNDLKDLIQRKYEVTEIQTQSQEVVAMGQ